MKHSSEVIDKIRRLRAEGSTLGEIITATRLSKTTIHHHIKNIPKSKLLLQKLALSKKRNQAALADKFRGKTRKKYTFRKPDTWSPDFVRLVAHFCFDGELRQRSCVYTNRSKVLLDGVMQLMKKLLDVDDYKTYDKFLGVKAVYFNNVEIATFMRRKADELWDYIVLPTTPITHKTSFLKTFFDDEGNIDYNDKKKRIRGYQHNEKTLKIVRKLLAEHGIESVIWGRFNEIVISKRNNLEAFARIINFSPGIRVNGKRSNSRWKRSLEKRKILDMALKSYL